MKWLARSLAFLMLCWGLVATMATPSSGQIVFSPGYGWLPGPWGYWPFRYVDDRPLPYFAAHPPVYYSGQITPRPYGDVPFASLPGLWHGTAAARQRTSLGPAVQPLRSRVQRIYPARRARPDTSPQQGILPNKPPATAPPDSASTDRSGTMRFGTPGPRVLRVSNPFVQPGSSRRQWRIGQRVVERIDNPFVRAGTEKPPAS